MGLFGKLFGALKKTKDNFSGKLRTLFSKNKLGDEFYEELEEILISSDVSYATAQEVVQRVKEQAMEERLKDEEYVTSLLRGILIDILEESEGSLPSSCLTIRTFARCAQMESCSLAAARKVSAAATVTVLPWERK